MTHQTDRQKQIEAMYHLEVISEPMDANGTKKPADWVDAHITAAHYLVQSMLGGYKPDNYEEVLNRAREFDALDEAIEAIHFAKIGPQAGEIL